MVETTSSKSQLGQFYTTETSTIFQGLTIDSSLLEKVKCIVEPFVGQGDLLHYLVQQCGGVSIEKPIIANDISMTAETRHGLEKQFPGIQVYTRDLFRQPVDLKDSFVLTNPPFLAKNKATGDKTVFQEWDGDDLYKCFLNMMLVSHQLAMGGLLIVPLNFWSSSRKKDVDLRRRFLQTYRVDKLNIFTEKVFQDTSSAITSFQFCRRDDVSQEYSVPIFWHPAKKEALDSFTFSEENNYTIGGEIHGLPKYSLKWEVKRITSQEVELGLEPFFTNILVKCIDDSLENRLGLQYVEDPQDRYIDTTPLASARSYCSLMIRPVISVEQQRDLVERVNTYLDKKRNQYQSLFLTNYRESKEGEGRKRLSFDLLYRVVLWHLGAS
jgi:hypothetical protein